MTTITDQAGEAFEEKLSNIIEDLTVGHNFNYAHSAIRQAAESLAAERVKTELETIIKHNGWCQECGLAGNLDSDRGDVRKMLAAYGKEHWRMGDWGCHCGYEANSDHDMDKHPIEQAATESAREGKQT